MRSQPEPPADEPGTRLPPPRPGPREEALASRLFYALAPRVPRVRPPAPPQALAPFEELTVPRSRGSALAATWYPAAGGPRGAVLFLHPRLEWGKAYFHRRGRLDAVRAAGLHALAVDLPGFGGSGPRHGFPDVAVGDALAFLGARCPGLALGVWGVSAGGYWAHMPLAHLRNPVGAFFEDVSPHLLEWSWRTAPWGRPAFLLFRILFRRSYRFLDLRLHAPHLARHTLGYVSGELDEGVRPADTIRLARLTRARSWIVPGAVHLASIRLDEPGLIALALETFGAG